jgi:hypothetical protein
MPDEEVKLKRPFWGWLLAEADGTPSASRFLSCLITIACIAWDTAYLKFTHALPPGEQLMMQAAFIMAPYGTNRAAEILGNLKKS